jgi:hypothetical protein
LKILEPKLHSGQLDCSFCSKTAIIDCAVAPFAAVSSVHEGGADKDVILNRQNLASRTCSQGRSFSPPLEAGMTRGLPRVIPARGSPYGLSRMVGVHVRLAFPRRILPTEKENLDLASVANLKPLAYTACMALAAICRYINVASSSFTASLRHSICLGAIRRAYKFAASLSVSRH